MHKSPISGVAASKTNLIATAGYDNRVVLWEDGRAVAINYHDHLVNACQFHPSGEFLVSASSDRTARVWRVPSLEPVATLFGHEDDVEMAVYSPDGLRIATASRDARVRVFTAGGTLIATLVGHTADVNTVIWSTDGRELLSSSDDGSIRRWCADTYVSLDIIDLKGVETDSVAIAGDQTIYCGNDNGEVTQIKNGQHFSLKPHTAGVKRLVLSSDESRLLSLSYDRHLCVFDIQDGELKLTHRFPYPPIIWARSAAFLDASSIVFGSFGHSYATLDLTTGQWHTEHIKDTGGINFVQSTPLGMVSVGDAGAVIRVGDAEPLAEFHELCNFVVHHDESLFIGGQTGRIYEYPSRRLLADFGQPLNCALSNGSHLVVGSYTGEILIVDPKSGAVIKRERLLKNAIKGIAIHDGLGLAVGAARDLCWFDPHSGERLSYLENAHDKIANGCAHLSGKRFLSVSRDRHLRIFEYGSKQVESILTPLNHSVKCIATDGRRVAVGSYGGQVAIYDTQLRRWAQNERPTHAGISSLAYMDGRFHASSYDGRVYSLG